jgi:glycogen phosphorylase
MTTTYTTLLPDTYAPAYQTRVAYFSMEYAIAQSLKIYAGGLGYLAGSHLRSAYALKQNVVGIGILWKYGYYDQIRKPDQTMGVLFQEKVYSFLQKLDLRFQILVNQAPVQVEVYYLPPATFGTAPLYLLSTDLPENDYLAQTITHKLYDPDKAARIAASILLGVGGAKLNCSSCWASPPISIISTKPMPCRWSFPYMKNTGTWPRYAKKWCSPPIHPRRPATKKPISACSTK